jgi:hypothetical protein
VGIGKYPYAGRTYGSCGRVTSYSDKLHINKTYSPPQHEANFAHDAEHSEFVTGICTPQVTASLTDKPKVWPAVFMDTHQAVLTRVMHMADVQKPTIQTNHRLYLCACHT